MKNSKSEMPLHYCKGAINMSHSFMKSKNVTQNLSGAPPLTHGSHCRTYHWETKEYATKTGKVMPDCMDFLKEKHVTLRHYPNVNRGTGFVCMLYESIKFCFVKRMCN